MTTPTDHIPSRPTVLTVDLDALQSNVKTLLRFTGGVPILAVVKANAYGAGALPVSRAALEAGAKWLGVAVVAEGIELRRAGIGAPVFLLGPAGEEETPTVLSLGLTPSIYGQPLLLALERAASDRGVVADAHIKLDSGMGRLGIRPEDLGGFLELWRSCPHVRLDGVFSHMASADTPGDPQNDRQIRVFQEMLGAVRASGFSPKWIHLANSAALLSRPEARNTLMRPGISLLGYRPSPEVPDPGLKPVLAYETRIIQVKDLPPGSPVGYNATFVTEARSRVGILPIGYADGLPRSLSNSGWVLLRGRRCPIVGRVNMDLTQVCLDGVPEALLGDPATLWGRDGRETLSPWDWALWAGTIPYEITSHIGRRVSRRYIRGGRGSMDWPMGPPTE